MSRRMGRVCRVLLAEDNPSDVAVFRRVVRRNAERFVLEVVPDGGSALGFLMSQDEWCRAWTPDLVVLNINMPKVNGWGVLETMKSHPLLKIIPVAMWTIAEIEDYAKRSFHAGCSGIFTKPVDPVQMEAQVAAMLEFYWWAWSYPSGEADQERGPLFPQG